MILDFSDYVRSLSERFSTRDWVLEAIDDWLGSTDTGPFLLTGTPGMGKSALAAKLVSISNGDSKAPPSARHIGVGFLQAIHFCDALEGLWVHLPSFVISISEQLAQTVGPFDIERLRAGNQAKYINVEATFHGQIENASAVTISHLEQTSPDPDTHFQAYLRWPLEDIYQQGYDKPIVILVDGLEQAILRHGEVNIATLLAGASKLPPMVRLILTSDRTPVVDELFADRSVTEVNLSSEESRKRGLDDVRRFVLAYMNRPTLRRKLHEGLTPEDCADFVADISEGNFLYASLLVDMVKDYDGKIDHQLLRGWPKGLNEFYRSLLTTIVGPTSEGWEDRFQAPLGALAVARVRLLVRQLADILDRRPDRTQSVLRDLGLLLSRKPENPASRRAYGLFHSSLRGFLLDEDRAGRFWCDAPYYHGAVAKSLLEKPRWWKDPYARNYLVFHLVRAHEWDSLGDVMSNLDYLQERRAKGEQYALQSEIVELLRFPVIDDDTLNDLLFSVYKTIDKGLETSDEKADWLDIFAYWLVEHGGGADTKRTRSLHALSRRFDESCADVSTELCRIYWKKGDYGWALRFAELATWVTQRAQLAHRCAEACDEAETLCRTEGIEEVYATLGTLEFMRMRAWATRALSETLTLPAERRRYMKISDSIYEEMNNLLKKQDQSAWLPTAAQWRLLEDDDHRQVLLPRTSRRSSRVFARVVSNTHDCMAAMYLIRYLERHRARVEWVHSRRFSPVQFSGPAVQISILVGGPKAPGLSQVADIFRQVDQEGYLKAYSAQEFAPVVLATIDEGTSCFMVGGPSKLNTLKAAVLLTRDSRLGERLSIT